MTDVLTRDERGLTRPRRLLDAVPARPALALLPLRAFLGVTFTVAALQKLANPSFFDAAKPGSIQGQLALVRDSSPLRPFLGIVTDHAVFFGVLIALTELAVGLATLFGLWQRLAAVVGGLVALSFFLTISWRTTPYYYGSDIVFVFAWTPLMLLGAPVISLDAWRLGRSQVADPAPPVEAAVAPTGPRRPIRPDQRAARLAAVSGDGTSGRAPISGIEAGRRAVLATGGVGAAFVLAAGLDAGIGRAAARGGHQEKLRTATPPTPSHSKGSHSASPTTTPAKQQKGTRVASASDVPVGGAKTFTDPKSGAPAYVVQPAHGDFRAFSAVCTHAGCTVAFVKGSNQFECPCHGSVFDATSGRVLGGPAPTPLPRIPVTQSNGELIVPDGA